MASDGQFEQIERERLERYAKATQLADHARAAWIAAGEPLIVTLSNGVQAEAPILRLMREIERDAARFAREIRRPGIKLGRPPVGIASPVKPSPAAVLREKRRAEIARRRSRDDRRGQTSSGSAS